MKKIHKIKQLNTYNIDDLEFEVLFEVDTSNSLVLTTLENFYNSLLHTYNRCVISGRFKGLGVTLKREDNKKLGSLLKSIISEGVHGDIKIIDKIVNTKNSTYIIIM